MLLGSCCNRLWNCWRRLREECSRALAFGKVYCFGPTFRAEKSKTRRHLTEFWMVEPEVAYFTLDQDMQLAEDFVSYILTRVLDRRRDDLIILERDLDKLARAAAKPSSSLGL